MVARHFCRDGWNERADWKRLLRLMEWGYFLGRGIGDEIKNCGSDKGEEEGGLQGERDPEPVGEPSEDRS